jgi:hypothetical protein
MLLRNPALYSEYRSRGYWQGWSAYLPLPRTIQQQLSPERQLRWRLSLVLLHGGDQMALVRKSSQVSDFGNRAPPGASAIQGCGQSVSRSPAWLPFWGRHFRGLCRGRADRPDRRLGNRCVPEPRPHFSFSLASAALPADRNSVPRKQTTGTRTVICIPIALPQRHRNPSRG